MSYIIISTSTTRAFLLFPLLLALSLFLFRRCDSYSSVATFYGSPDSPDTPGGYCGYGEYGRNVLGGTVAGVSERFFLNGSGCGSCFQLKCGRSNLCSYDGVNVVVTDSAVARRAQFVLTASAFAQLARARLAATLFAMRTVPVEYRRISCSYPGYNLHVKVHEDSRKDEYLAVVVLYQGGRHQLAAVEILPEEFGESTPMRKSYGCVWESENPPFGALSLRLELLAEHGDHRSVELTNILPAAWEAGEAYDSNMQLY